MRADVGADILTVGQPVQAGVPEDPAAVARRWEQVGRAGGSEALCARRRPRGRSPGVVMVVSGVVVVLGLPQVQMVGGARTQLRG